MIEPDFYAQKEKKLLALASSRFATDLSAAESEILHDSVRPGVPEVPKDPRGKPPAPEGRTVRPALLRWIVVDSDASALIDINGIWVLNATIDGHIDLEDCKASFGLNFLSCILTDTVGLSNAAVKSVFLQGCNLQKGIVAEFMKCEGGFEAIDCEFGNIFYMDAAQVNDLHLEKSKFPQGLSAAGINCGGAALIECECNGIVSFNNARIAGNLLLTGSHIGAGDTGSNFGLNGAVIGRNLMANFDGKVRFRCDRTIEATGLEVGRNLEFIGAEIIATGDAVHLDVANIKGELMLMPPSKNAAKSLPFTCNGTIHMPHIHIGQDIHSDGAVFNGKPIALEMVNADIGDGAVYLDETKFAGSINCTGANIADGLWLERAQFTQTGTVLTLDGAIIGKYLALQEVESAGAIRMNGGTIDGTVACHKAKIDSLSLIGLKITHDLLAPEAAFTSISMAINLASTEVDGTVELDRITSSAYLQFVQCKIKESLTLIDAKINVDSSKNALYMRGVDLEQGLGMYGGFETDGAIEIDNGSIGGNISCVGAKMDRLRLFRVQVSGNLYWFGIKNANKTALSLSGSSLRSLYDDVNSWPGQGLLEVTNFIYDTLELRKSPSPDELRDNLIPEAAMQTATRRVEWLTLQDSNDIAAPQPWLELSRFLEQRGDDAGAKHALYTMRRLQGYSRSHIARVLTLPYDLIEEEPLNITYPILFLWALGSVVFWRAHRMQAMAPADSAAFDKFKQKQPLDGHVPFNPIIYALENVLPVVKFGQDDSWAPNPEVVTGQISGWKRWLPRIDYRWLALLRWMLIALGWALALILAGAIAGRFKS